MKKNTVLKNSRNRLSYLHYEMQQYYVLFQLGFMSEKEYLTVIKSLDEAIDALEMSTLKEYLVLKEASSVLSHLPEM
jgi:hypothetical protein